MAKVKRKNAETGTQETIDIPVSEIQPGDVLLSPEDAKVEENNVTMPWEAPEPTVLPESETVGKALPEEEKQSLEETTKEVVEEKPKPSSDMLVVFSKLRFSVDKPEGGHLTIEKGESVIPKWAAEHWYAKSQGLRIIGIVEDDSIQSALSQHKIELIDSNLKPLLPNLESLEKITDLTDSQKELLSDAYHFVKSATESFDQFTGTIPKILGE